MVPDNVTAIGREAFYKCSVMTSVTIPNGVTEVEINSIFDGVPWPKLVKEDFAILGTIRLHYNGTSATIFNPSGSIKRQEAAAMLARTAEETP